jgi:hypothetical protein
VPTAGASAASPASCQARGRPVRSSPRWPQTAGQDVVLDKRLVVPGVLPSGPLGASRVCWSAIASIIKLGRRRAATDLKHLDAYPKVSLSFCHCANTGQAL